jgi:hypothetical protein
VLDYILSAGLNLVLNSSTAGGCGTGAGACTTGLLGLTGDVLANGTVELFATNYTLDDLNSTFLYAITDTLSDATASEASGETFSVVDIAPADSNFKGVAFAPNDDVGDPLTPTPLAASWTFMLIGLAGFGLVAPRRRSKGTGLAAGLIAQ